MTMRALLAVALLVGGVAAGVPAVGAESTAAAAGSQTVAGHDGAANLSVRTLVAPRSAADRLDTPANVTAIQRAGLLTNTSAVPLNGTLVVELSAPGFADEFAAANGSNATARFRRAFRAANVSLAAEQTNPGTSQRAIQLDLVNASATRVVADPGNDTYYLVVDLRALNAARNHEPPGTDADRPIHDGDEFRLNLSVPASSRLAVSGSAETTVVVVDREASVGPRYDGDLRLPPVENATVSIATTLPPGSRVTVRLAVGGEDGFARNRTVAVTAGAEHPHYAASFDLSGVPNGTPVAVSVVGPAGSLTDEPARGRVVEPTASVSFVENPEKYRPWYVRVDARLAYPGSVVVHAGSADGPVVGAREFAAGPHDFVRVELDRDVARNRTLVAVVAWDADGDREYDAGDPVVTQDGSPVRDELTFAPAVETTTATTTRTTRATTESTTRPTTTDGQPGFGAAVAALALAAAALLARQPL